MLYSIAPASVLIINLILNWESLKKYGFRENRNDDRTQVSVRYNSLFIKIKLFICAFQTRLSRIPAQKQKQPRNHQ